MQKKHVSQILLYCNGILGRMKEKADYFIAIDARFDAGTKSFPAHITREQEHLLLHWQAAKIPLELERLTDWIAKTAAEYDAAQIIYRERGTNIIIEADGKRVRMRYEDAAQSQPLSQQQKSTVSARREYKVNPALAANLLKEIGILAENGKIKNDKIRKYNQIDYFVELMDEVLGAVEPGKELVLLDCACGKSYLSFVLNFYLCEIRKLKCRFIGVDYNEGVIKASQKIARKLGYHNMEFVRADLKTYQPPAKLDAVISLHACDTATDMALALGIRTKAKAIVCVPCCHKDLLKQYHYEPFAAVIKHGILKARLADTLTDGIRSIYLESRGYKVSLIEYISPTETPKNIMIRATYQGKPSVEAKKEYEKLKQMLGVSPAVERFLEEALFE